MKGKITIIFIALSLSLILIFMPAFEAIGFVIRRERKENVYLTIWHVDTFEGGENSRKTFLSNVGIRFNKVNKNVFVIVREMSVEGFLDSLKKGEAKADMLSFGASVSEEAAKCLMEYTGKNNVEKDFLDVGTKEGVTLAIPWAYSGYFMFEQGKKITYGVSEKSAPLIALALSNECEGYDTYFLSREQGTEEAFKLSMQEKSTLLGINRDVVRMNNYVERGITTPREITPLAQYVDLVCAIGITKYADKRTDECVRFIEYLTSDKVQKELSKLKLFSPSIKIYDGGTLFDYENCNEKKSVINLFEKKSSMESLSKLAELSIKGENGAKESLLRGLGR